MNIGICIGLHYTCMSNAIGSYAKISQPQHRVITESETIARVHAAFTFVDTMLLTRVRPGKHAFMYVV